MMKALTWTLMLVLLSALCLGIPTDDQASDVTGDAESGNVGHPQQKDNHADPKQGVASADESNKDDTDLNTVNDFTKTNELDIPDYDSLVAMVKDLQTEMKGLLDQKAKTAPDNPDQETEPDQTTCQDSSGSSIYTRWGRDTCPSTANKVYAGFAAGSYRYQTGGGSGYLCLPHEPVYHRPTAQLDERRAQLFGVEYEPTNFPPFANLEDHDSPCAVCESVGHPNVLMVPARLDCPSGWIREYYGYLMAQNYSHQKSDFVCVDYNAESIPGTDGEGEGGDFFPVEGRCTENSGMPCGPYVSGYELTCAVCTK